MRRTFLILSLVATFMLLGTSLAAAGPAVKFETIGLKHYTGIGIDYEFDSLVAVPGVPFVEAIGWVSMVSGQPTHGQLGAGARFFLDAASGSTSGTYAEAKFRLFAQGFHPSHQFQFSFAAFVGVGYRTQAILNGVDIILNARITGHHVLPSYTVGVRVAF